MDHLPPEAYALANELLTLATDVTRGMPRDARTTLGLELRRECIALIAAIGRVHAAADRAPHLDDLRTRLQVVVLFLRLSHERRFISPRQWARSAELAGRIGTQALAWDTPLR